jgi:hypothetical protein
MARRGIHRLWLAMLLVVAGIGLAPFAAADAGADAGADGAARSAADRASTVAITSTAIEAAVVPARTEAGPGSTTRPAPGRSLLPLLAALVALAGVVGLCAGRAQARVGRGPALAARRYAIALRAPPAFQLV